MEQYQSFNKKRITSIDALRAFTLLGIMIVHACGLFAFKNTTYDSSYFSVLGQCVDRFSYYFLSGRCSSIFAMLFGVSFYLVLKNPNYSSKKFIWRCCLLIGFGLLNKIFYTNEALVWYGVCGIVLVFFRNKTHQKLLIWFAILFILNYLLSICDLRHFFYDDTYVNGRYNITENQLMNIVRYPIACSVYDYIYYILEAPLDTLYKFVLGYYFAKRGIVDHMDEILKVKHICFSLVITILFYALFYISGIRLFVSCATLSCAILYVIIFIVLYNKVPKFFRHFEAYGKLGLTNYSLQGTIGVIIMSFLITAKFSLEYIVGIFIGVYMLQLIFSNIWMCYFTYGPFEYIWRCLTNLKFYSIKK